jgi:hypothetical protein
MEVSKELNSEIWDYCRINNITNIDEFMGKCLKQGFTAEKYGATPTTKEKIVEVEVEKIVEVPVEKIVEKIVEIQVEKEVYITDDKQMKKLTKEIDRLNGVIETNKSVIETKTTDFHNLEIENNKLKRELEIEKKKKKTDLYGE